MQAASTSNPSSIQILDLFYMELAETADVAGVCLPWYKTSFVHTPELKRFRSEITLPGLRLLASDAKQYFIPEAKFTAIAQTRNDAENAAAGEACEFLKTFTGRSHLIASEWSIDNSNPLYQELEQSQGLEHQQQQQQQQREGGEAVTRPTNLPPTEGEGSTTTHSLVLTISPMSRSEVALIQPPPLIEAPPAAAEQQEQLVESSGRFPVTFTEELYRLRRQIEVLSSLVVDREPVPVTSSSINVIQTASISSSNQPPIASTSATATAHDFQSEIEPA
eukprot:g3324.t1